MNEIELTTGLKPAKNLEETWSIFDPTLTMDPRTQYYIPRTAPELQKLFLNLRCQARILHDAVFKNRLEGENVVLIKQRAVISAVSGKLNHKFPISVNEIGSIT